MFIFTFLVRCRDAGRLRSAGMAPDQTSDEETENDLFGTKYWQTPEHVQTSFRKTLLFWIGQFVYLNLSAAKENWCLIWHLDIYLIELISKYATTFRDQPNWDQWKLCNQKLLGTGQGNIFNDCWTTYASRDSYTNYGFDIKSEIFIYPCLSVHECPTALAKRACDWDNVCWY